MIFRRAVCAHTVSVLGASLILLIGLEFIAAGPVGLAAAIGKWIGGVLIFAALAVLSIPVGLLLRWIVGLLPVEPLFGALFGGAAVSFALIPVLHPAMYPTVSLTSHPASLIFVHLFAGLIAGGLWHLIEFPPQEKHGE